MQPEEFDDIYFSSNQPTGPELNITGSDQKVSSFGINEKEKYAHIISDTYTKRLVDMQIKTTYVIEGTVNIFFNLPAPENAVKGAIYRATSYQTQTVYYYDGWECVYKDSNYVWEPISYISSASVNWHSIITTESSLPEPNLTNVGIKYRKSASRAEYETRQSGFFRIKEDNSAKFWERDDDLSVELNNYISNSNRYIYKVKYKTEWLKTSTSTTILKYDYFSLVKVDKE